MKYKAIDLNQKIFGDDFIVYDWKEVKNKITIFIKAASHEGICPVCGQNLNLGECGCDRESLDPRMSAIRDIFKNFKEV